MLHRWQARLAALAYFLWVLSMTAIALANDEYKPPEYKLDYAEATNMVLVVVLVFFIAPGAVWLVSRSQKKRKQG